MELPKAELEHWMREFYFTCQFDLGSSGVQTYTFGDIRNILEIPQNEIDAVVFDDSLTKGGLSLRTAIANRWGTGDPEKIMVTNGSNEILYLLLNTLLKQGDEVVVLDPIYHALSTVAESAGCQMIRWKLRPESHFKPNIEELEHLITPRTRLVCVNFPHNPTGISITHEEQKTLLNIVSKVGAYLIWDAAFEEMTDHPLPNPQLEYEHAISVGTLSKGYGLPGMRIGWCFSSPEVLEPCIQLRDYTTLYVSPLLEFLAQKAIEQADKLLRPRMDEAKTNMKILEKWIQTHQTYVDWVRPQGGVTCLINLLGIDDTELFCRSLMANYNVMLVPGKCFEQPNYVRLGYGCSTKDFEEGLKRFSEHLKTYQ